jgi:DNA replication protein DnaC
LASQLNAALADVSVERLVDQYVSADLIILDELGFTPLNRVVADHLFRIVSERYERGSMIVTSNKPFEQWAEMFVDPILANAALDRLIHHAHVVPITGESYRMKDRRQPPQPPGGKPPRGTKPPS